MFFRKAQSASSSKATPQSGDNAQSAGREPIGEQVLSKHDIINNAELLAKARKELELSEEPDKDPRILLQECLTELEEKGFLNSLEN